MITDVLIRAAVPSDASAVARIYVETSNQAFQKWKSPKQCTNQVVQAWAADLADPFSHWWIAEISNAPIGFAGVRPSRDPADRWTGELDTIAVVTAYQRLGVGTELITEANAQLDRDYDRSVAWTWADYPTAARFYLKSGWSKGEPVRDGGRQISFWRF